MEQLKSTLSPITLDREAMKPVSYAVRFFIGNRTREETMTTDRQGMTEGFTAVLAPLEYGVCGPVALSLPATPENLARYTIGAVFELRRIDADAPSEGAAP